jgi:hypothetical protein
MKAWGIAMAAFSLFGMLALWVACDHLEDQPTATSSTRTSGGDSEDHVEYRKAA